MARVLDLHDILSWSIILSIIDRFRNKILSKIDLSLFFMFDLIPTMDWKLKLLKSSSKSGREL